MATTVSAHGPIFDGQADRDMDRAVEDWAKNLATVGASMVRTNLAATLRNETPYYRLQVEAKPEPPGYKITDQGVIYGPWLEGTGSRNRTTRFKGYFTFRRTTAAINARAKSIGEPIIARWVARWH